MDLPKMNAKWKDNSTLSYVIKCDYDLKYRDVSVIRFNPTTQSVRVLQPELLPYSIQNHETSYGMINRFCASRIMMLNRPNYKELLLACKIDDQKPVPICIAVSGLSFTDNYWICRSSHNRKWDDVNLFENEFSPDISQVALTGKLKVYDYNWDGIYTGELTLKGSRRKGVFREADKIILYKNETSEEISSEVCSSIVADVMGIEASEYRATTKFNLGCSACEIATASGKELISFREIMEHNDEYKSGIETESYKQMMQYGGRDFIMMQLFDYVMLNGDRNRDNYGLVRLNGEIAGLYPLFDHDSCFKPKNTDGIYFPTAMSFKDSLAYSKTLYRHDNSILDGLKVAKEIMYDDSTRDLICEIKSEKHYDGIVSRLNDLIK